VSKSAIAITVLTAISTTPGQIITPKPISIDNPASSSMTLSLQCAVQSVTVPQSISFPKCSLDTQSLSLPGSGNGTVTLTISTVGNQAANTGASLPVAAGVSIIGLLGFVLLGGFKQARRRALSLLSLILVLSALLVVPGCGGGFNNPNKLQPPSTNGTQPGNFVVAVTGTATEPDGSQKTVAVATVAMKVGI